MLDDNKLASNKKSGSSLAAQQFSRRAVNRFDFDFLYLLVSDDFEVWNQRHISLRRVFVHQEQHAGSDRRREVQRKYNEEHGTAPVTVAKEVRETVRSYDAVNEVVAQYSSETREEIGKNGSAIRLEDIPLLISQMEKEMKDLAKAMEFEKAGAIRDEISELRKMAGTSDGRIGTEKRKNASRRFAKAR